MRKEPYEISTRQARKRGIGRLSSYGKRVLFTTVIVLVAITFLIIF